MVDQEDIDESPTLADLLRTVQAGKETAFEVVKTLLPDGSNKITLAVQNRELLREEPRVPVRAPSPRRAHAIYNIAGFRAYLEKYRTKDTVIYANPINEQISAVLNEVAADGFEIVVFTPQIHPIFCPWNGILTQGKAVAIKDFVDFIATNRRAIIAPAGRELLLTLAQVRMSRNVTLYQGTGKKSTNGVLVETNIAGKVGNDYMDLPETIVIRTPIYLGTDPQDIEIDVTLGGNEEQGVIVRLSTGDLIAKKSDLFEWMLSDLASGLENVIVTLGQPGHQEWRYLT